MRQQSILLIVLAIIILGIVAVVGINKYNDYVASSNLEAVTADLTELASRAQSYFNRSTALGGGGGSFALLTADNSGLQRLVPKRDDYGMYITDHAFSIGDDGNPKSMNGRYYIFNAGTATGMAIQGEGNEDGDGDGVKCKIRILVYPGIIHVCIINR